jgi:dolichol-phosphate mannosyltransferase
VAPFRAVFAGYELLPYLSHCAPSPRVPLPDPPRARRYPPDHVPTKISSVRGNGW